MLKKYLLCALISMVPLIELRGGVPVAVGMGLPYFKALIVCAVANMLPVPVIYFFARKVLEWGRDKKYIGKFFTYCIEKGEHGGEKLTKKAGERGLFVALMLFVGIPLPGTGAWTGALIASLLQIDLKKSAIAILLGVGLAAIIMSFVSYGVLANLLG